MVHPVACAPGVHWIAGLMEGETPMPIPLPVLTSTQISPLAKAKKPAVGCRTAQSR